MWMEEHIGKRVNHERVEEALDTGASKIATGLPVLPRDDDRRRRRRRRGQRPAEGRGARRGPAAAGLARQELGHAARKGHGRKGSRGAGRARSRRRHRRSQEAAPAEAEPSEAARRRPRPPPSEARGRRSPSRASASPAAPSVPARRRPLPHQRRAKPAAEAKPRRGCARQGTRHRRGRQAARRQEGRRRTCRGRRPTHPPRRPPRRLPRRSPRSRGSASPRAHAGPAPRRRRRRPRRAGEATVAQPPNVDPTRPQPGAETDAADSEPGLQDKPEPEVKGLGIAPGARRPGAKKAPAPPTPNPRPRSRNRNPPAEPAAAQPEPSGDGNGERAGDAGEGPRHRQGCATAGQALSWPDITAWSRWANSICHR